MCLLATDNYFLGQDPPYSFPQHGTFFLLPKMALSAVALLTLLFFVVFLAAVIICLYLRQQAHQARARTTLAVPSSNSDRLLGRGSRLSSSRVPLSDGATSSRYAANSWADYLSWSTVGPLSSPSVGSAPRVNSHASTVSYPTLPPSPSRRGRRGTHTKPMTVVRVPPTGAIPRPDMSPLLASAHEGVVPCNDSIASHAAEGSPSLSSINGTGKRRVHWNSMFKTLYYRAL